MEELTERSRRGLRPRDIYKRIFSLTDLLLFWANESDRKQIWMGLGAVLWKFANCRVLCQLSEGLLSRLRQKHKQNTKQDTAELILKQVVMLHNLRIGCKKNIDAFDAKLRFALLSSLSFLASLRFGSSFT